MGRNNRNSCPIVLCIATGMWPSMCYSWQDPHGVCTVALLACPLSYRSVRCEYLMFSSC